MSETHKDQEFVEYVVKELVDNPDKVVTVSYTHLTARDWYNYRIHIYSNTWVG